MKQTKWIFLAFTVLPLSLLCLLFLKTSPRDQRNTTKEETVTPVLISSKLSTKWWIKATVTSTAAPTGTSYPLDPTHQVENNCFSGYSEPLQTGTYAYISPDPPIPNRIRAGAGKDNTYLGQVQPGTSVKIIDGSVCADGSLWWLVESIETRLRGWTVMGNGSQQWIIPCPNPNIACEKLPVTPKITPTASFTSAEQNINNSCNSSRFVISMFAQVAEDNLLVVRSEPYTGFVIGRAEPMSTLKILDGPVCVGNTIWWEVNLATLNLTGWVNETNLHACAKENNCF